MKKEIDVEIKPDTSESGRYDLYINGHSVDWFKIHNSSVIDGLDYTYREILDMKGNAYEDYQKLLDSYLEKQLLTEQELVSCIAKHNGDWKLDWSNKVQEKYYFYLEFCSERIIKLDYSWQNYSKERPDSHYMADREGVDSVIAELGEDRIIEFYKNW